MARTVRRKEPEQPKGRSAARGAPSRPSWKGSISFGLVSVPVRLHVSSEEKQLRFHLLHAGCGARVKMPRTCSEEGVELSAGEIVKGYDLDGTTVIMEDADFDDLPVASKKLIQVDRFVDHARVDPASYNRTYYLAPEDAGKRGFALLWKAMERTGTVGIGKVAFRENREHLVMVWPEPDGRMLATTLRWPDEIREPVGVDVADVGVRGEELDMAVMLIRSMYGEFAPDQWHDAYREALLERIAAKSAGRKPREKKLAAEPSEVVDMMAALKASVDQHSKQAAPRKVSTRKRRTA